MNCKQCKGELDLLGMFTAHQVCNKCCIKNHKEMLGRVKKFGDKEIKKQTFDNLPHNIKE